MKSVLVEMNVGSEDIDSKARRLFESDIKPDMRKIMDTTLIGIGPDTKEAILYLFEKAFIHGYAKGFTDGVVCGITAEVIDCTLDASVTKH